jgi:polysaccharide export outer membrane protein
VGDELSIWALGVDEPSPKAISVDPDGYIDFPMAGRVKAAGLTVQELKSSLGGHLTTYVKKPEVTISIVDYHSQPVSVIGAVKDPGVRELRGGKRLVEVIAMAGGITAEGGNTIYVTRRKEWGPLSVEGIPTEDSEDSHTVKIPVNGLLQAGRSEYNILLRPHDTVTVPRAHLVYVLGDVNKPGGYVLNERESISVLEVLTLAGGMSRTASAKNASILRVDAGTTQRRQIAVNLKQIVNARSGDLDLRPDDILFVPNSASRNATLRVIEAGIQVGTGLIIWR